MAKAASVISTKAKAFVKGMNATLEDKRKKKVDALAKKGVKDAEKKVYKAELKVSKNPVTLSRTPEKQAESVASGRSWTCASAHMVDKARHVPLFYTPPGKSKSVYSKTAKEPWGSKDEHFMSFAEFSAAWAKELGKQGVRNYKGKQAFDAGDAWHIELPSGKLLHSDPAVAKCLIRYAELTRLEGHKPNTSFENSKSWKKDLAPHLKAVEARKEKERIDGLKKLRFSASLSGSQSLLKGANKAKTPVGKSFGDLEFEGPIDCGAGKEEKVAFKHAIQWDSLARDVFEFLGLAESKGFDVRLTFSLVYSLWHYDNLSQAFLAKLIPSCKLEYNTPAAKWMSMTVDAAADVSMKKSGLLPEGTVTFSYDLRSPLDKEKGKLVMKVKGSRVTAA
ncbi:MAG: hypothetical protein AB3N24_22775 [Leisingera sp.]